MATSLLPELSNVIIAGGGSQLSGQISLRQRCEILRSTLELERGTFLSQWRDLAAFILPRRPRFTITDVNKGDRRNQQIIDSTATEAVGTLAAGMMTGMTSPARPWFKLLTGYPELDSQKPVQEYLAEVEKRMSLALLRSNFYNKVPLLYQDMGTFATGAMFMMEDDETVFRFYDQPIGSYCVSNNAKMQIRTFTRTFQLTVQQMVEQWGEIDEKTGKPNFMDGRPTRLSENVQNLWRRGNYVSWIPVAHVIRENLAWDDRKIEARYKRFQDIYYELSSPNTPLASNTTGTLSEGGFDEFPVLVGRWETNSEDAWGTNCPGMRAIGDIRQLQVGEKRSAQGTEKMINPPLTGPSKLNNVKVSVLPGDVTYDDVRDGQLGLRPIYQFDFSSGIKALEEKQEQVRQRIRRVFKEDLFLMFVDSDRRDITATEIMERKEEKLLALGPVLWQFNEDVLDPLIERAFNIMIRKGLMPEAPEELAGVELKVEYISIMAQAQKAVSIAAIERFAGFINQIAQSAPQVLDRIDDKELIDQYAEATGVPPKILRSDEAVDAIRQARAQAAAQQQRAENAPKIAGAAKDLAQAPTDGNSALAQLLASAAARSSVDATAQPVASVIP